MGQDLGTRREGLPNLDEARAKIFEERTQFFGGEPLQEIMLAQNMNDLVDAFHAHTATEAKLVFGINISSCRKKMPQKRVFCHHDPPSSSCCYCSANETRALLDCKLVSKQGTSL